RLTEPLAELVREQSADEIRAAARRRPGDDPDRARRPLLGGQRGGERRNQNDEAGEYALEEGHAGTDRGVPATPVLVRRSDRPVCRLRDCADRPLPGPGLAECHVGYNCGGGRIASAMLPPAQVAATGAAGMALLPNSARSSAFG